MNLFSYLYALGSRCDILGGVGIGSLSHGCTKPIQKPEATRWRQLLLAFRCNELWPILVVPSFSPHLLGTPLRHLLRLVGQLCFPLAYLLRLGIAQFVVRRGWEALPDVKMRWEATNELTAIARHSFFLSCLWKHHPRRGSSVAR